MTAEILIVVPVLNRPANARPLVESVAANTTREWVLLFVCSRNDDAEIEACLAQRSFNPANASGIRVGIKIAPLDPGPGDYAMKIQAGYDDALYRDIPNVLLAADDLRFHPGWDTAALEILDEYDVGVVGTCDLGNRQTMNGKHSTHPFVARAYIDAKGGFVGGEGQVYFQGYDHQFVDVELVATAKARGCYAHAYGSVIEHLHPLWRKGETDATYAKGQARGREDRRLYESRRHLWEREKVSA